MTAKRLKPDQIAAKVFVLNLNSFQENLVISYYGTSFFCRFPAFQHSLFDNGQCLIR